LKNYPEFHDGFLDGLLLENSIAHIFVSTRQEERLVIEASDVAALAAGDFKKGNILFEVLTRSGDELTLEDFVAVDGPLSGTDGQSRAQKTLEESREKDLILLEINPSYGAACLVLAGSVQLYSRKNWISRHMLGKE
jgi:hypothetical protein